MKKNKKFLFTKKFYIILTTSLLAITMLALVLGGVFDNKNKPSTFKAYTSYYNSPQYEIGSISAANDTNIITMTAAASAGSVQNGYTITISSADELYLFSDTINKDSDFLGYQYKLTGNIDYNDKTNKTPFKPVEEFSGTFDGMGYEIENLILTSDSEDGYVSMFATNSGTISNFGLVNPNISVNKSEGYVAPICGINSGEISYVFVRDLRNPQTEANAGILSNGYYLVSGLVYENNGSLHDSYVAYEILVNREAVDSVNQFSELLAVNGNSATISNLYFYHGSIESYEIVDGKYEIKYDSGTINKEYSLTNHYGTYSASIEALNTNVTNNNSNWYAASNYGELSTYLSGISTPISRGITLNNATKTFTVSNEADYSYMYELMNLNDYFASSNITYEITNNINLALIPKEKYVYNRTIDATIKGVTISANNSLATDTNSNKILYPSIYNATIDKISTEGIDCYGLFSYVSGKIENLNIANLTINFQSSENIQAAGLAVGYLDGGEINNVNTFGDITFASNIGKFYVGHVAGLTSGDAIIKNVTSAGSITNTRAASAGSEVNEFMSGSTIGGIAGYATSTLASFDTCTSAVDITAGTYQTNNNDIAIGGILGAGYTNESKKLENRGTITVNGNSYNLYVAGIIGRHLGLKTQSSYFNNAADITVTLANQKVAMVSGVVNADIQTKATSELATSSLRENGRYKYYAAAFTNGANIVLTNSSATNLEYTNVLNINSSNGFESKISGIYNLQYRTDRSKTSLGAQSISMNIFDEFAPVVNVNSSSTQTASQKVDAQTVFNLRSLDYTTSANLTGTELKYSGCMLGDYINYTNVRNEGDMTFNISHTINVTSFKAFGVFESVNSGYYATSIYNGGNIKLDANYTITANIYFSGICYANYNGYSNDEHDEFNPLSSDYISDKIGSLNNIINKGNITVNNSTAYNNIGFTYSENLSANEDQLIGITYNYTNIPTNYVLGDINISGITYINESVITNAFNLGDIVNVNYANGEYSLLSAGISNLNISKYAYILNCANNGVIKTMNLSTNDDVRVYSSGISNRNDINEDGTNYNGGNQHSSQLISFTINYGSIYSYSYTENISSSADEPKTNSSGILSLGMCNIINTVNYGNIYSSETSSGIFGVVYFSKFTSDVSVSNQVNISNSINYANVYVLEKGDNLFYDDTSYRVSYRTFMGFTDENINSSSNALTITAPYLYPSNSTQRNINPIYAKTYIERTEGMNFYIGSVFSLVNFNNDTNANNVRIRFLISFNSDVKLLAFEAGTPQSVTCDVSKIYSSYYQVVNGIDTFSTYMGQNVTYAPLSSSDNNKINQTEYIGVFSENFEFRKAIEGNLSLDISNYPSDKFITDYFQYVNYQKINPVLLDKIGWRTFAYQYAANSFASSLEGAMLFNTYYKNNINLSTYTSDVEDALSTGTWSLYSDIDMLLEVINEISKEYSVEELKDIIEYYFSHECSTSILINNSFRASLIEYLISADGLGMTYLFDSNALLTFENGYSSVLAEILCEEGNNSVKLYIKDKIDEIITNLSPTSQEDLLISYVEYLKNNGSTFFNSNIEITRYNLLKVFFENINDTSYYEILITLFSDTVQSTIGDSTSDLIMQYDGYSQLSDSEKIDLFMSIISENDENKISNYLDVFAKEIGLYNEYNITSFDDIYNKVYIENVTTTSQSIINERIALYNQIRETNTFSTYLSSLISNSIVDKATEHNNTFQSNIAPQNTGTTTANVGYSYTETVTPSTYFYGPYQDLQGTLIDPPADKNVLNANNYTINFNNNSDTGYYHVFMTTNQDIADRYVAEGLINPHRVYMYEYGNTSANNQFTALGAGLYRGKRQTSGQFTGYYISDFTGCQLREDVYVTLTDQTTGEVFSTAGGAISGFYTQTDYGTSGNPLETGNYTGSYLIIDKNGTEHRFDNVTSRDWINFYNNYGLRFYFSTPTQLYNQTFNDGNDYGTGIIINRDNNTWFTLKGDATAVKTSQYIKYNAERLLMLDGVYSTYGDGTSQSLDERNIINRIFEEYLLTSSNVNTFKKIIKKALLELSGDVDFIDNMIISNIKSQSLVSSTLPLDYLSCDIDSKYTVSSYLESKCSQSDNIKSDLIIAASTNLNTFTELIEKLIQIDSIISNLTANELATISSDYQALMEYIISVEDSVSGDSFVNSELANAPNREDVYSQFDMTSDTYVSNIYGNTSVIAYSQTNYNSTDYTYGLKTSNHLLTGILATDAEIVILAKSADGTNSTVTINGKTNTVNGINEYVFDISDSSNTSFNLVADKDIIIYSVYTNKINSANYTYTLAVTNNPTALTIPSISDIENTIATENSLTGVEITASTLTTAVRNSTYTNRYVNIYLNGTAIGTAVRIRYTNSTFSNINIFASLSNNTSSTLDVRTSTDESTYEINSSVYFYSSGTNQIVYTYNYLIKSNDIIINEDIVDNKYLNVDLSSYSYTVIAKNYLASISYQSIDYSQKYDDLLDELLVYFTPLQGNGYTNIINYQNELFTEEFYIEIAKYSNSYLFSVINTINDPESLVKIIDQFINYNYKFFDEFIIIQSEDLNDNDKLLITSAYLATDYKQIYENSLVNSSVKLTDSIFYDRLCDLNSQYVYIDFNGNINNDKFDAFAVLIGYNTGQSGYGIYALSSSKGILNGEFLPDNIVLDNMDVNYEITGNNYFELSSDSSSNWRGGTDSNENDTANNESVNYAVLVEMKQLKKSIGTTIFELNLVDNSGVTHYSSESAIDLENGIITYYVPTNYFNNVSTTLTIEEDTISVSNLASICMSGNTTDLREDNAINTITLSNLQAENVIRVYAEDTTVYKDYTIEFVEMEIAFDLVYSSVQNGTMDTTTQATVNYKDGIVVLSLTSDTLPEKLDLTPYIDIYSGTTLMERITSFKLSNEEDDHVINSSHDSLITMEILSSLPYGEYTIKVNIFGVTESVTLIKNPSTECEILEFEYDGIDISSSLITNNTYTNYIDFGRLYNYDDLTNPSSNSFYLNRFSISENATCDIEVDLDEGEVYTYTITYTITAENGNKAEYTHILIEKYPFANYGDSGQLDTPFTFASYYEDGEKINSSIYHEDDEYYDSSNNSINVEFDRGFEPQYRIKYTLSNFYTLGEYVDFIIDTSGATGATYVDSYAGITATVTDDCEAGAYTFVYNYYNKAIWSDGEYEREFEFPKFVIVKNYSKDATLNNVTYIDGLSMLSSQSTVINADKVFRPVDEGVLANEIGYYDYLDGTKPIAAMGTYINYNNIVESPNDIDYSDSQYDDYYLIGSLSNAKLAYYSPIFKIEDHAEIYQYTTRYKLDNYGEGLQDRDQNNIISDYDILNNHNTTYIYVPYTTDGENVEIFLVEVNANNQWTNVYTVESNATNAIATVNQNKGSFTYNGNNYAIHSSAGKPTDNTSLYMDYIGTPLEDHFWYVSYVVFSEDALHTTDNTNIKYFHLSLIDLTNNIYFDIQVNAPKEFELQDIYVTFAASGVATQTEGVTTSKQLSAYVTESDTTQDDYDIYLLDNEIQILPSGYYYFYLDLPNGYKASYEITNDKDNRNQDEENYPGAYLPPSSIVTQRICITFTIEVDSESADIWGVSTSEIYSRQAILKESDE